MLRFIANGGGRANCWGDNVGFGARLTNLRKAFFYRFRGLRVEKTGQVKSFCL